MFPSAVGTKLAESNIRRRALDKAIAVADKTLTKAHEAPLPDGLTPHKLRHTFASILVALGVDPGSVMDQLGHADPAFTLRIYRHGCGEAPLPSGACGRSSSATGARSAARHYRYSTRCRQLAQRDPSNVRVGIPAQYLCSRRVGLHRQDGDQGEAHSEVLIACEPA